MNRIQWLITLIQTVGYRALGTFESLFWPSKVLGHVLPSLESLFREATLENLGPDYWG